MILFARLSRERAETYRLVCAAEQIDCRLTRADRCWRLHVSAAASQGARRAIALYAAENPEKWPLQAIPGRGAKSFPLTGIIPAAILASVFAATGPRDSSAIYTDRYSADAGRILEGEVYRTVTALLLHGDIAHLLGNCAGLVVFGTAAANLAGWGTAWLMILMAGGMGNYANALFYQFGHRSIGASTAVFGAVGILACLQTLAR